MDVEDVEDVGLVADLVETTGTPTKEAMILLLTSSTIP